MHCIQESYSLLNTQIVLGSLSLSTIAYNIKSKWENHLKKTELNLGGEQELDWM